MEAIAIIFGALLVIGFCVIIYTPFSQATKNIVSPAVVVVESDYYNEPLKEPNPKSGFTDKQWDKYQNLIDEHEEPMPVWDEYEGMYLIYEDDADATERYSGLVEHYKVLKECYEKV